KTLWLPGTDHAAIATQNVVEKKLWTEQSKTRFDFTREDFIKQVTDFVGQSKTVIRQQVKAMGVSCDWSRERYTLDKGLSRTVQEVFVKMYDDDLIYRGKRIVNWCTRCGTTLADDEVEYKEQPAKFYYLKYGPIVIGTARPETKVLDKVIIVHPEDARYQAYVGKEFEVPWIDGTVRAKVVADPIAEMETGSGAMTITPAHSFVDFDLAKKYGFEVVEIIGSGGRMTSAAGKFAGLKVKEARAAIVEELQKKGLVERIDEDYVHNLSTCYRCSTPVEPMPLEQWFVAVDKSFKIGLFKKTTLKKLALKAVSGGQIKIIPERFDKVYFHWINNLRDWCISRQIWFGHRVPVWYCGGLNNSVRLKMGFAESVIPRVLAGMTKTYRIHDHNFKIGDRVGFESSQTKSLFGYGTITNVERRPIKDIPLIDPLHKTSYESLAELLAAFRRRYPTNEVITSETEAILYTYDFESADSSTRQGCGQIMVVATEPKQCPKCGGTRLIQDPDTLDTWFSSSLWTFSTLLANNSDHYKTLADWLKASPDLKEFHPTSVMETGYDILFFWVARMILMTTYMLGEVPFREVYLHGLVRDKLGRKMSKSLNNGIDPLAMIDKYGADALRLSMIIGNTPGNDFKLYEEKIAGYRNFINKLWNISRFILMSVSEAKLTEDIPPAVTLADKWILSRFSAIASFITNKIETYEFSAGGEVLYDFTWHELADWYLEVAKVEGGKDKLLNYLLTQLLKLWHPYTPYITEVLWQEAFGNTSGLLMVQSWPKNLPAVDEQAEKEFKVIQAIVTAIRTYRAEQKVPLDKILAMAIEGKELDEAAIKLVEALRTKVKLVPQAEKNWLSVKVNDINLVIDLN
ncbi:MAG: class I tRNA ligase family protein, partial [Candidatus Kerfeldbacteria bacterium]|nr:class I tRNA ligase family protein [Candidatus Kerfeldbacteria bacterium]